MKIIIDPQYNSMYASFYLKELIRKFGKKKIYFLEKPFLSLKHRGSCFNFIIEKNGVKKKYTIDHSDADTILEEFQSSYEWSDVYGKVNTNWIKTPKEQFPKLISLVPNFGVRAYNNMETVCHIIKLLLFKIKWGSIDYRKFIGKHKRLQNRLFYEQYENNFTVEEDYIFHLSTLWYNDEWNKNDEGVNRIRANFVRLCKHLPNIHFEGGLLPQKSKSSYELFKDVVYNSDKQMSISEYIEKTKKSVLVFNTPSFWNCHGWKLGEFLAMGKAIISMPLSNNLPYPLEHGINIHFLKDDSEEELKAAINQIVENPDYRKNLEAGAKKYWETYGTPGKSLELMKIK